MLLAVPEAVSSHKKVRSKSAVESILSLDPRCPRGSLVPYKSAEHQFWGALLTERTVCAGWDTLPGRFCHHTGGHHQEDAATTQGDSNRKMLPPHRGHQREVAATTQGDTTRKILPPNRGTQPRRCCHHRGDTTRKILPPHRGHHQEDSATTQWDRHHITVRLLLHHCTVHRAPYQKL